MIKVVQGDLLNADVEALVNTVNTVGVAGKGIALQFRLAYPDNFTEYARNARAGKIIPGKMFVTTTNQLAGPRYIINFPTKRHWKAKSRLEDVESGLEDLASVIGSYGIRSIAVPPLGCGYGGLSWQVVQPLIQTKLRDVAATVLLYSPDGAPPPEELTVNTARPTMTRGRAALVLLLHQYAESDLFRLSALEVQKLAYFMQEAGEALRLRYVKAQFGPYADNLNQVLVRMEGHFTRGLGDRSKEPRLRLLDGVAEEATEYLNTYPDTLARTKRVARLVRGWETPYGLELLATTHWAMKQGLGEDGDSSELHHFVANWTPRKAKLFPPRHIDRATAHLVEHGFTPRPQSRQT
jgi:Predicted phosphatase homologous to the C-terminal domain of histone macroH2A1